MIALTRIFFLAVLLMMTATRWAYSADIDRAAVDFKTPSEIKWVRNAAGTNESAVIRRSEQARPLCRPPQMVAR